MKIKFKYLNGYVLRYAPDHPRGFKNSWYLNGYVYEHILVVEKELGRYLKKSEEVHHLDSIRSNNSPNNLLFLKKTQHSKLHHWIDRDCIPVEPKKVKYEEIINSKSTVLIAKIKRCKYCRFPIRKDLNFCCNRCSKKYLKKKGYKSLREKVEAEKSEKRLKEVGLTKKRLKRHLIKGRTLTWIGKKYNYSGNGIKKIAKRLGVWKYK